MSIQEQLVFHRNAQEQMVISTPKFEGFKYLNVKNNIESQNIDNDLKKSLDTNNSIIEERITLSERKNEKKPSYINFKLNNSTDKKKYYTSIFYNYKKLYKDKPDWEKQISFDEKSENYLFTNKNKNNNRTDINDSKCFEDIKEEKNLSNDKKENEDFNYDLPLEMDKSSDIFNFTINHQNQMTSQKDKEKEKEKENACRITKFQEFNYNNNLLINSINNEKNENKISINFRKLNNINDDDDNDNYNDNKNNLDDKSKKYFSFDGGNQTNDEIIVDKNKDNSQDIKDNNNKENKENKGNDENRKIQDNNIDIKENEDNNKNKNDIIKSDNINYKENEKKMSVDSNIQNNEFTANQKNKKNLNSFKKKFLLTDILNNEIIFKQYCNTEEKENPCHINNNEDENKLNNMIYTPKKEYARKFNSNIQSKINKIPKGYSIQRKKKLINKNLIGYLAFNNSNSIKSKNSHIYEDSFSYKKSLENSKINDFNPTRKLVFEGINDSIESSGRKKRVITNYKEISKCNKLNKNKMHSNYSYEIFDNKPKESIYLQFNSHLNQNRHFDNDYNNNTKKYYPKNERFYKYITKNKKKSLSNKHSIVSYDNDKRYSSIDFNNYIKISKSKEKLKYKYSPGRENNKTSMNGFYNSISIGNNYIKNNHRYKENSNIYDEKEIYHSLNFADDKNNKFINKRNNTLKSLPVQTKVNLIKVNKISNNKNIKNSENAKKKINKFDSNENNNTFTNRLTYTNSSKMLKIKNSVLNNTNSEFNTNNKINKQNFTHKTTKINHTNNLKMKIESFKKINSNSRNGSYESFNNFMSHKSSKEVLNKKKVITKKRSNFDEKKVILVNKDNNFYKNFNSRNYYLDQTFNTKYYTNQNQNKGSSLFSSQILKSSENDMPCFQKNKIKVSDNKAKPYFNKIKNVVFNKEKIKKYKNSNLLKNSNYRNSVIKKNQINKNKISKNKIYNFDSFDMKSSINMNNNDIIKYSIIRNNQNNQVSHAISVTFGNNDKNKRNNENNKKNYKKTIINVNQYYPSYYINTNNLNKTDEEQNKITNNSNNLFKSENSFKTIIIKNKK